MKHDGFHCFSCYRSPWPWLWSVLLLEDMLNFKVHTDTGHHIEVRFMSWHGRSHWYPSSYLPQETLLMSQIISVIPASLCGNINMSVSNCQWNLYWEPLSLFLPNETMLFMRSVLSAATIFMSSIHPATREEVSVHSHSCPLNYLDATDTSCQ